MAEGITKADVMDKFKGTGMFVDDVSQLDVDWVSTGIMSLDLATEAHKGTGGIPLGRITEVFGDEGAGKSTLILSVMAEAQKDGLDITYFDAESAYNPSYAEKFGIDNNEVDFSMCSDGNQIIDMIEAFAVNKLTDLIIIDSVHAVSDPSILESEMDDNQISADARMWSKGLKKIKGVLAKNNVGLILINQLRTDINVKFGDPNITTGGKAIKFYSDLRIRIRRGTKHKSGQREDKVVSGHDMIFVIIKNKVGKNGKSAKALLEYGEGINRWEDLISVGSKMDLIEQAGPWYKFIHEDIEIKGQGKDNFIQNMEEEGKDELLKKLIRTKVQENAA